MVLSFLCYNNKIEKKILVIRILERLNLKGQIVGFVINLKNLFGGIGRHVRLKI